MKRVHIFFVVLQIVLDAVLAGLAFYLAFRLRLLTPHPGMAETFVPFAPMMVVYVAILLLTLAMNRMYRHKRVAQPLDELYIVLASVTLALLLAVAIMSLIYKDQFNYQRKMLAYAWGLSVLMLTVGRVIVGSAQKAVQARGIGADRVLIVGTGEVGRMILQKIIQQPELGYRVVGFIGTNGNPRTVMGMPVLGRPADIPRVVDEHKVDEVIIALPEASHQEIVNLVALCEREKVGIKVFPDVFQIMASEISIGDLGGLPLLTVRDVAMRGWRLAAKRLMDIVGATVGLILLSPLMILTAIAIKLESPGPVFYVQERMGLDARPFKMLKFRSMYVDAERDGPGWTRPGDPRVTRVGRIIRKYSIDELPQLINVLMGDMSLVGPRPERPVYVEQFRQSIPRYMERHREKAGLTGWAQIHGLRGDTSIAERTKYDLWYIENWSLWLDIKIIIRTLFRIFRDRNAY